MLVIELIHRFDRVVTLPFVRKVVLACIMTRVKEDTAVCKDTLGSTTWISTLNIGDASGELITLNLLKGALVKVS